ncbi:hypothetical protein [Brevibacterium oceani]|uniref:hypothetical protein n=1 Tax=Brevibacterium oceani TaxID=358099 RepID=UPI0015E6FB17|nr:hypothetical protein [Brevibacterium oceani]
MANYSVQAEQLTEGTTVSIRGKLAFARLTRRIEGDELAKVNQRKIQNGMSPVNQPHTTATITEADVVYVDPANPTAEERFVAERRYASKKNPDTGANYSIDSKGNNLPIIGIPSPKGDGTFDQDTSGRELDRGLDVELVLRVYKPKNYAKRGLALEQVIVHETPRYYGGSGVDTADLKARGIVFNSQPQAVAASEANPVGSAPEPEDDGGEAASLPAPAPQAAPQVQAQPAAAAQEAPAAAATATAEESPAEKLARLEAENAALKNAGSAVGEPASATPWNAQGAPQGGITYQS